MLLKNVLIVTALAVLPMSAYAATDTTSTPQAKFSGLDKNDDGFISRDEAKANKELSRNWSMLDTNVDGKLEEAEFSAFEEEMAPKSDSETSDSEISAEPKAKVAE